MRSTCHEINSHEIVRVDLVKGSCSVILIHVPNALVPDLNKQDEVRNLVAMVMLIHVPNAFVPNKVLHYS